MPKDLIISTSFGFYCPPGDFYIDAWKPVSYCLITHGHSDHATRGSDNYLAAKDSLPILHYRLENDAKLEGISYGEKRKIGKAWVSFHPAGHILGSSQIRIEHGSSVWVFTGDFKRKKDLTCPEFEPIPCDTFLTETTFGLPIYKWKSSQEIGEEIFTWWKANAAVARPSVLFCYALGKAQRILGLLKPYADRKIRLHGAVVPFTKMYEEAGKELASNMPLLADQEKDFSQDLILAPPSAFRSPWMKRFPNVVTAFASGWMAIRGMRRRKGLDKGFVLSDHADWEDLLDTITETGAQRVLTMHGYTDVVSKYLQEITGVISEPISGVFVPENVDEGEVLP